MLRAFHRPHQPVSWLTKMGFMWPVGHNRSHLPHLHPLQHTVRHKCVATEMQEVATEMQEVTTEMQEVATARIIWKIFL